MHPFSFDLIYMYSLILPYIMYITNSLELKFGKMIPTHGNTTPPLPHPPHILTSVNGTIPLKHIKLRWSILKRKHSILNHNAYIDILKINPCKICICFWFQTKELHKLFTREEEEHFSKFVYMPMDLNIMETKVKNRKYRYIEQFQADAQVIHHNIIICYTGKVPQIQYQVSLGLVH